ncbi:MAG: hypothetical protein Q8O84_00750, partial [Nanoarchaeota archaeon]|nr:hypothetical protein [Nanoarchaeota archaeon]
TFILMRWKVNSRGQQTLGMPIGMIFSIFLIVVFIVIAFIAVKQFLKIGGTADVGIFYQDLQKAVDDSWNGQSSEKIFEINLPSKIEKVCFGNLSLEITGSLEDYNKIKDYFIYEANIFLIPPENAESLEYHYIEHIDLERIIKNSNPYCVSSKGGLKISKDFYDKLVFIE